MALEARHGAAVSRARQAWQGQVRVSSALGRCLCGSMRLPAAGLAVQLLERDRSGCQCQGGLGPWREQRRAGQRRRHKSRGQPRKRHQLRLGRWRPWLQIGEGHQHCNLLGAQRAPCLLLLLMPTR
jgi:hypothetical protein